MSAPKPTRPLAALEARSRHALLMVGLGFFAYAAGSLVSAAIQVRVRERLAGLELPVLGLVLNVLLTRFWLLFALPAVGHAVARFLVIRPWAFALTAALTGELFWAGIQLVMGGLEQLFASPEAWLIRVGTFALGTFATARAVRSGLAWAQARAAEAMAKARAKQSEYDEYLKASQALADKREASASPQGAVTPRPSPPPGASSS